ncbi:hypothetical protein PV325_008268 [Microctonus aethiopoides]|uniref:Uncharacterized protein n=1 Tax=Microctonus aethiopoides TaxID=144406 RepID=A0AA39C9W5_9HYME|nr:hypothetical protein PV325_008268 [Microctonus aethiopoides]KAK0160488.1 hypothetical protein PV328_007895 [Microctonus aethiopoides]
MSVVVLTACNMKSMRVVEGCFFALMHLLKMKKIREEREAEREIGERLMEELGLVSWSGDFYFDYCGIRWMIEGRWGLDHPSNDPSGIFWSNPNAIYDIYD